MLRAVSLFLLLGLYLYAGKFVVVANAESPIDRLTQSQVRMLYLKKKRFWGDTRLVVLNLPPQNALRKRFEHNVLKMDAEQWEAYWAKQHYMGHRPPYRVESVKSMLLFIKKVKGAVGYLPKKRVGAGVKIIYEGPSS
ncbi:hypothetical protein MNB_SV-10-1362 [hydrothermal vent metagenome]|uniref:PBP domain-containing protein n=1 Tax=hydrothermal vent metagenome TaxID=652676 RepID=A0A1W1BW86_9ZZZZ